MSLSWYAGTPAEDVLVAGWWHRMEADGDLAGFAAESRTLASLFRMITPPHTLTYDLDADGIWFAFWTEPLLSGIAAGVWVRSDYRQSKRAAWTALMVLDGILRIVPVIVTVTKFPRLVRFQRKLGYTVVGEIPAMFDGEPAIVMALTREGLHPAITRLRHTNPEDPPERTPAARRKTEERMGLLIPEVSVP